jgi:hypothetical protein
MREPSLVLHFSSALNEGSLPRIRRRCDDTRPQRREQKNANTYVGAAWASRVARSLAHESLLRSAPPPLYQCELEAHAPM